MPTVRKSAIGVGVFLLAPVEIRANLGAAMTLLKLWRNLDGMQTA